MRTVVVRLRRQPRRVTKRCSELYETAQPRSERSSWMRVNWSWPEVTQRSICSAHGASISSLGTSVVLGPARLSVASATSCCSGGSGPSRRRPAAFAASTYRRTVTRDSPVPVAMRRWLCPACQRRMISRISTNLTPR